MKLAPVVLFVYNRPLHTKRTVEALKNNELAHESDLIIFSDAPKNPEASTKVAEVRQYIKTIDGFKSIKIVERDENWGLANSIIDGVAAVVNEYGRIIVLEDDLVTSSYFIAFMNNALDVYQNEERVMHISGYMFPINISGLPETFFLRTASCWGWATWDRAWRSFKKEPERLLRDFSWEAISRFNMDGAYNFWIQVEQNANRTKNTWAIFWYASVFEAGGLCLHPAISMVSNIGHDDTGEHCKSSGDFSVVLASKPVAYFEANIAESAVAHARTRKFLRALEPTLISRIMYRLRLTSL